MPSLTPEQIQYQMSHKDDDRRAGIVASISIMLVVAYGAVILRVVARRIGRVPLKMDDWMIMVGLVGQYGCSKRICRMAILTWTTIVSDYLLCYRLFSL